MTIDSATPDKIEGTGDGSATSFSFSPIKIYVSTDMTVVHVVDATGVETELTEGAAAANYAVDVSLYPGTGSITYPADAVTPMPAGEHIEMRPVYPIEQQLGLGAQGGYDPDRQEKQFDKCIQIDRQQQEELNRSFKAPVSAASFDGKLPAPITASSFVMINATADGLQLVTAVSLGAVVISGSDPIVAGTAAPGATGDVSDAGHVHPSAKDVTEELTNKTMNDGSNNIHANAIHLASRNVTGGTLNRGDVVHESGYNSGQTRIEISLADADDAAKMPALGIVDEDIANNTNGELIKTGIITGDATYGLDTSAWAVGDNLYVDVTAGALTNTRPTGKTTDVQAIAVVLRSHASLGSIFVDGAGRANSLPNSATAEAGFLTKSYDIGNTGAGNITPLFADGNAQHAAATGSFTLLAPTDADEGWMEIEITVDATGGYSPDLTTNFNNISGTFDATALAVNLCRIHKANSGTCYLEITQKV